MKHLVIEGNIGAGKTTLVKKLSADLNARAVFEKFEQNPYLSKFYENPQKYSLPLELSFLCERYRQLKEEMNEANRISPLSIADYYFSKSLIFASVTLADDEYRLYRQLYDIIYQDLPKPDLYVYLHASVERLMGNIRSRGRIYEKSLTEDYLKSLENSYFEYFALNPNMKFLILDIENLDFINTSQDYKLIKSYIFGRQFKDGINRISGRNNE